MKNTIIGIGIGIVVAVTAFQIWFLFNVSKEVNNQGKVLQEVVNFLNQATNQQDKTNTMQVKDK